MNNASLVCLLVSMAACSGGGRSGGDGGLATKDAGVLDLFQLNGDLATTEVIEKFYAHDADTLYLVDPNNFDLTTIGTFGTPTAMTDLAVDTNGDIYGITSTAVFTVSPVTGAATQLATGITTANFALTMLPDHTLLASDAAGHVFRINPQTGASTQIGEYGGGFDTAGDLVSVADGTMFGISKSGPGTTTTSNVLLTVNTANGAATGVGPIGYKEVFGIAYSKGNVIAFTKSGQIIKINPMTGAGTLVRTYNDKQFYGAGSNPLQPIG